MSIYPTVWDIVRRSTRHRPLRCLSLLFLSVLMPACTSPGQRAMMIQQNESYRRQVNTLERAVSQRDGTVANLRRQVEVLQASDPMCPSTLFAPVRIEIATLSGGADYDDKPGDDGITVYVRPYDADGDAVKAPARITVELIDSTTPGAPRVMGVYKFNDADQLRGAWYGRFGTQHYSLRCPFPPNAKLPTRRRLNANVSYVDCLTGATLTATQEVAFAVRDDQ